MPPIKFVVRHVLQRYDGARSKRAILWKRPLISP
jgi:hypothetical protein